MEQQASTPISQNPRSLLPKSPRPSLLAAFPPTTLMRQETDYFITSTLHRTQTAAMLTPTLRSSAEPEH